MSLPYFPMFPTDFDADTGHLTFAEDGAYNRLLRLSWKCPGAKMPDDMDWIHRRARAVSVEEKALVASVIAEFFTRSGGKIFSPRLAKEWQKSSLAHSRRILAGSSGGKAKALNAKESNPSNAKAMLYQPEPEPEPDKKEKREAKASPKNRGARLSPEWFLPMEWGDWALTEGMDRDAIRIEADKFRDYWCGKAGAGGVKLDWLATWRNWIRTAKERGNGNRTSKQIPQVGKRSDPAIANIARLAGLSQASGDGGFGAGSSGEEDGPFRMGPRHG